MHLRVYTVLTIVCLCLAPTAARADLTPYSQDSEGLVQADPGALANDGWWVFGNVFNPDWSYAYGYGSFPAPNGGPAFSAVVSGEGGPSQDVQQLSVYSDYNNTDHGAGKFIEANVFQEQTIGAADVGSTWLFEFDAKRGNIEGGTTARAFFKTLHPTQYWLSRFIWIDMTDVPDSWGSYSLAIAIDPDLEGHIFQFGFLSTATHYEGSGIFYDNVVLRQQPIDVAVDVKPGSCPNPLRSLARGMLPVAVMGTGDFDVADIDVTTLQLQGVAPLNSGYEDVSEAVAGDPCACTEAGPDGFLDLTLRFLYKDILDALGPDPSGDYTLTLTGTLLDGTPIEGQDCVFFVGGGGGGRPPTAEVPGGSSGGTSLQRR